jgi:hypothetical protein
MRNFLNGIKTNETTRKRHGRNNMILKKGIHLSKKTIPGIFEHIEKEKYKHSYAYFAGWADGDGCLAFKPKYNDDSYKLPIQYEEPVEEIADLYKTSICLMTPDKREWINETDPRKFTTLHSVRLKHFAEHAAPFLVAKQKEVLEYLKRQDVDVSNIPYQQHSKKEFIEWFTGFAEAEGTFTFTKQSKCVTVSNYDTAPLQFIIDGFKKFYDVDLNMGCSKLVDDVNSGNSKYITFRDKEGNILKQYTRNSENKYRVYVGGKHFKLFADIMLPRMKIPYKKENATQIAEYTQYRGM